MHTFTGAAAAAVAGVARRVHGADAFTTSCCAFTVDIVLASGLVAQPLLARTGAT